VLLSEDRVLSRRDLRFEPAASEEGGSEEGLTLEEMERRHIERVLQAEQGKVEAAARRLGIPRSSLYQKIKRMGLATRS
jgi:transcriptional regulator of acetoin/glycerol metabolism